MSASEVVGVTIKLENHIVPVTDVDRAKGFYQQLGWRLDDDVAPMDGLRFVQFTPPGSPASITFGLGLPRDRLGGFRPPSSSPTSRRPMPNSSNLVST